MVKGNIKKSIPVIMIATALLLIAYFSIPAENTGDNGFGTLTVSAVPDASPATGASGILHFFIIDHDNRPANYALNISDSASYVLADANATSFSLEIPHSTAFDIVVKCRANKTHAYDTAWNLSLIRCNITATGDITLSNVGMTEVEIAEGADYVWVNYYLDNGGSGYTIPRDGSVTISSINFQYYG